MRFLLVYISGERAIKSALFLSWLNLFQALVLAKLQILLTHFAAFKFDLFLIHKMLKGSVNEIGR